MEGSQSKPTPLPKIILDKCECFEYIPEAIACADELFLLLSEFKDWATPEESSVVMFGRRIPVPRKVVHFSPDGVVDYKYSGHRMRTRVLPESLRPWFDNVCIKFGVDFNHIVVNRYKDGQQYIGAHSDNERNIDQTCPIVGVSVGAVRKFVVTSIDKKSTKSFLLGHGSAIVMRPGAQAIWKHSVPKDPRCHGVRFNLTFRKMNKI